MNAWFSPVPLSLAMAGLILWSLALYVGFWQWHNQFITQITVHLGGGSPPHPLTESMASLISLIPALVGGSVAFGGVYWSLGLSWATSLGFMTAMGTGIYQLGRSDGKNSR